MSDLRKVASEFPQDGLVRYYFAGNVERVLVFGIKELEELLVTEVYDFSKSESLRIKLLRFTGNGLLLAEGEEHKVQRRAILPSFSYRHIKDLYPCFWGKAVEMAEALAREQPHRVLSDGIKVRMSGWARRVTLDIISTAGMGEDFGSIRNVTSKLSRQYTKLKLRPTTSTRALMLLTTLTIGPKAIFWLPTKWNRESKKAARHIRAFAKAIVKNKQLKRDSEAQGEVGKDKDIASLVLESGVFSDEDMVNQMMTFLAAGHETISTTLQYAVRALSENPDMQHRLRDEVRTNLPSPAAAEADITAENVDRLPYLSAFCNEVLRYYPTVPSTVREAKFDTILNGTFIPKGTSLLVLAGVTNLSPDHWGADAGIFNPDRWLGPGRAKSGGCNSHCANLSFLAGPRGCIGQYFAKSELLCLVAVLVGRFQISLQYPDRKLETIRSISEGPKDGTPAIFVPLDGW